MLQAIRDRATGWIAYGIIGFLIIPFAFWGIDQYRGGGQISVAEVAGVKISQTEFQRAYQNQQSRMQEMLGGNLDPDTLESLGLRRQVLDQLIDQQVLNAISREVGLRVSDEALGQAIHEIPAFQNSGNFDPARYRQLLASQGYTSESFEAQMRSDIANQQLQTGVTQTFSPTAADIDLLLRVRGQRREIETLRLSFAATREAVETDDEDLTTWFSANRDRFQVPERAQVRYLELDATSLGAEGPVTEEELRALYAEQKGRFMRPAERTASYVLLPLDAAADEAQAESARQQMADLREQLQSGELSLDDLRDDPVSKGFPAVQVGELGVVVAGMLDTVAEKALGEVEEAGQYSELVRNDFGYQILRLDEYRPEEGRDFAEVKGELEADARRERGENRFYELADELATLAYENPGSLEPAAEALGLQVQESEWISRGVGEGLWSNARVLEEVFSTDVLEQGLNSQAVEIDATHVVVLRLLDHEAARPQELDEVREAAQQAMRDERAREALSSEASAVVSAVRGGATLESEAERTGGSWEGPRSVSRTDADLASALREVVFALPHPVEGRPSIDTAQEAGGDRTVVVLRKVEYVDPGAADPEERDALRTALTQEYGQSEFGAMLSKLRDRTEVQVFDSGIQSQ
jgi:peptidyl-prolyl cis-trans isomerase D